MQSKQLLGCKSEYFLNVVSCLGWSLEESVDLVFLLELNSPVSSHLAAKIFRKFDEKVNLNFGDFSMWGSVGEYIGIKNLLIFQICLISDQV